MSVDNFIKKHKSLGFKPSGYFRGEGENGVKNLARLCHALGYADPMYFGQFEGGCCYGDLINFLEDNPGAVEAIVEWVEENYSEDLESDDDLEEDSNEDDDSSDDDDDDDDDDD